MLQLMFPTHLAIGYLLGIYSRYPIAYLVLGSALPDLVDRPLYWLGLMPFTHTVGHSIAVAVPVCVVAIAFFGQRGVALAIGWLAHIATDVLNVVTSQGLSMAPYYVLYVAPPPDEPVVDTAMTIVLPVTDITHTAHPIVLLVEFVILCWAVAVVARDRSVVHWLRGSRSN